MRRNYFLKPITKTFMQAFPKFKKKDENDTGTYFWETWTSSPFYENTFSESEIK